MIIFVSFIFLLLFPKTAAAYFDSHLNSSSIISLKTDWVAPPTPQLISPADNAVVFLANFKPTWGEVIDDYSNPITYEYQSCSDSDCQLIITTERLTETTRAGQETGHLFWRVKAIDALGNQSPWSEIFSVIVYVDEINLDFNSESVARSYDLNYQTAISWPLEDAFLRLYKNEQLIFEIDPRLANPDSDFSGDTKTHQQKLYLQFDVSAIGTKATSTLNPLEEYMVPLNTLVTFSSSDPDLDFITSQINSSPPQVGASVSLNQEETMNLTYFATDKGGTVYPSQQVKIIVDGTAPSPIDDLLVIKNYSGVNISWISAGETDIDIRYQSDCSSLTDFTWETASVIQSPPQIPEGQTHEINLPLSPDHYCFAAKIADPVHNWSGLSNLAMITLN